MIGRPHAKWIISGLLALMYSATAAAQPKPLRWGADAEGGAPYIFPHPRNPAKNIGYEVDLARALGKELGRPIEFVQYPFINLVKGLEQGDFDLAMNGLEITPDRKKQVRFTKPYYAFRLQLVVREDEDRFTSLEGCRSHRCVVGTLEDTAASRYLEQRRVRLRFYDGQVEPYQDLDQHMLDAVLLDWPIAMYYARKSPVTSSPPPLKFVGDIRGRGYYAIAVAQDNKALADQLDSAIDRLIVKGEWRRILQKWRIWNRDQEEFLRGLLFDVKAAGLLATLPYSGHAGLAALIAEQSEPLPPGEFAEADQTALDEDDEESGFLMLLLKGAAVTVFITLLGFLLAVALGLPIALLRLYGPTALRWLAMVYVEFFRGIPVLLLVAFLYYGLPAIAKVNGLDAYGITLKMHPLVAAILGFGLNYGAYEAEIYRAGIASIPVGQWEAAASLGMSNALTFRRVILPQAIRVIVPPMTNDLVALFKDTSVVSVVAVVELTKQYLILTKSMSEHLVTVALATAALYLIMSVPLGYVSRYLEQRWGGKEK